MAGMEKRRSTEQRNTGTISVTADLLPENWTAISWKIPVLTGARRTRGAMKRSKFSEGQIAYILRQAEEGTAIGEVCCKAGISEATFYVWRNM